MTAFPKSAPQGKPRKLWLLRVVSKGIPHGSQTWGRLSPGREVLG